MDSIVILASLIALGLVLMSDTAWDLLQWAWDSIADRTWRW